MSKQKIILFLIIAIVLVVIVILVISAFPKAEEPSEGETEEKETLAGFLPIEQVDWENPDKPMSSPPLEEAEIPEEAIRMGISAKGFEPSIFEVKKGEKTVLSVSSQDEWTHIFKFKDESLATVAVGVGPGETRAITFYAPSETGEYEFFCDVPGHETRGERGKMIVK